MIAAAAFLCITLAWLFFPTKPSGIGPGSNVLLITLDTTRADYLGCYGRAGGHTPNIDRLASNGTLFTQCSSAVPSTLPSHATIMTGQYPFVHGIRHNVGYRLQESSRTLAEALEQSGYDCAAFVSAMVVDRDTGLDQGFETYGDVGKRRERRADEVTDKAVEWLRNRQEKPFFLWVHYFDPHAPYAPPVAVRRLYNDPYQAEIAFVDEQVGRLLEVAAGSEADEQTLVVLTADHGEGLGQHGEQTHLHFVYDTTMSVPLILQCPERIPAGKRIEEQTRTVDIAPSVLAFLGLDPKSLLSNAQGVSLIPRILDEVSTSPPPSYGESLSGTLVLGTAPLRSLRTEDWKYIHAPKPELYNLSKDRGELINVIADFPQRALDMADEIGEILHSYKADPLSRPETTGIDSESLADLAALGYLGGTAKDSDLQDELGFDGSDAPDPKDHAAEFASLGEAMHYLQTGEYRRAEQTYRDLVRAFPDRPRLTMQLARSLFLQDRFEEAIDLYEGLLMKHPDDADVHYGLGKLLQRVGKLQQAQLQFEEAIRCDPDYAAAYYDLGVLLLQQNDSGQAADAFTSALKVRPTYVDAMVNLAICFSSTGDYAGAIGQYERALRVAPDDAYIHFNLANAFLRAGEIDRAISSYQQALRLHPNLDAAREALMQCREISHQGRR